MKITIPFAQVTPLAVSASLASSSVFLNNIGAPIHSASIALNIVGASGSNGANAVKTGIEGDRGDEGDPAPDGLNVYLLDVSRATCGGCAAGTIPQDLPAYPLNNGCPTFWTFNSFTGCCVPDNPE